MNLSSVNKNFLSNITIEKGYVFTFLVIVFSVDFHFLWLLYDFLALFALYFFSKHVNVVLGSTLVLVLSFFVIVTIISGFHIISVLSIWDNIKHVFVLFMLLFLVERHIEGRILKFANSFGFIIGSIFIIQSTLVFYQSFNGYFKDDISGTFGTASGHTFAYYCLLYLSYLFYVKRSYLLTFCVFVLSLVMNYLAENMGYYPLVLLLLSYNWWTLKGLKSMIFYGIALLLGVMIIDNILGGLLIQPVLYRFSEFFLVGSIDLDNLNQSRGYMTALALYLGGWWGSGPGCYSEIYSITGWEYLAGIQLNISSVTNLLAEYGAVGVLLWLFLYFSFIKRFFKKRKDFIFIFMLFTSSLLYNKVLNDERVIFLLIFLFMYIKIYIDRKVLKND
jgi:membrane-associated phospholipid phosphatase